MMDEAMCGTAPWWGKRMQWMEGGMLLGKLLMMHAEEMGITEDQIKKMRDLWMDFRKTKARTVSEIQVGRIELHQMLMQDDVDPSAVERQVRKIEKLRGDMALEGIKAMLKGRELLSPEQRKQFESLVMKTMGKMHWAGPGMRGWGEPAPPAHEHHHG